MGVTSHLVFDPTDANSIAASHSVGAFLRASDGTLLTATTEGSNERLDVDVYLTAGNAGTFGIFAEDTAHTTADLGQQILTVRADSAAALAGTDGDYQPLITDASGRLWVAADIVSGAEYAEDSAHTTADIGNFVLAVRNDSKSALAGTDGDYIPFQMNASGEMYVVDEAGNALLTTIDSDTGNILTDTNAMVVDLAAIEVELLAQGLSLDNLVTDLAAIEVEQLAQGTSLDSIVTAIEIIDDIVLTEDAVHATGDKGVMGLAVRNDTLATLVSADGDYAPFQVNADGALYVDVSAASLTVTDIADTAIENATTAVSTSAVNVVSSALANRKWLFLANEGNKSLYFGKTGVTTSNGFPLHRGMQLECRVGPSVTPQVIGGTGASSEDLRVMELS